MPRCLLVFEPPDGGVAAHVAALAQALPEHGWSPVVAGPAEAVIYPELERAGVELVRLPIGRSLRPGAYTRALGELRRLVGGFDLVHAHSSKAGAIARVAALGRVPSVYTPHCFGFVGPVGLKRKLATTVVEGALGRVTAATICVAEEERRVAARYRVTRRTRLHVVHNGCPACPGELAASPDALAVAPHAVAAPPPPDALAPLPALAELAAEGPVAACVSVLRRQKGVDVFLRAAPLVLERRPDARLAVVGNGDLRAELEALARSLGLDARVRFVDFEPPAARALASLDVFVLPSRWEAFPISVLEAMACGVPQVATDVGGTAEAVADGQTGLLCPPEDPLALADRIVSVLGDRERQETMAAASRRRHADQFTIELMTAATANVYRSALCPHETVTNR
jgi:glycosyltransferase involved in cell wall biosynthesis